MEWLVTIFFKRKKVCSVSVIPLKLKNDYEPDFADSLNCVLFHFVSRRNLCISGQLTLTCLTEMFKKEVPSLLWWMPDSPLSLMKMPSFVEMCWLCKHVFIKITFGEELEAVGGWNAKPWMRRHSVVASVLKHSVFQSLMILLFAFLKNEQEQSLLLHLLSLAPANPNVCRSINK